MRKKNYKGRCEKRSFSKCPVVCKTYDVIQSAYADMLQSDDIDFSRADLHDIAPENYTLYKIAKSIYTESGEVGVDELADPDLVSTEVFHLVINAMLIYRYGMAAAKLKTKENHYGSV